MLYGTKPYKRRSLFSPPFCTYTVEYFPQTKHCFFFSIFTTPKRWRWQFENSCLGVPLHMVALCYCYLMSSITLSFGRRWGEYRTPWLNQFRLIPPGRYRQYLFTYRWARVVPPTDARALSEWHSVTLPLSGTAREQTARQQGQTSGCYLEARVVLQGCIIETDSPHCWSHFVLSRSAVWYK